MVPRPFVWQTMQCFFPISISRAPPRGFGPMPGGNGRAGVDLRRKGRTRGGDSSTTQCQGFEPEYHRPPACRAVQARSPPVGRDRHRPRSVHSGHCLCACVDGAGRWRSDQAERNAAGPAALGADRTAGAQRGAAAQHHFRLAGRRVARPAALAHIRAGQGADHSGADGAVERAGHGAGFGRCMDGLDTRPDAHRLVVDHR